MRPSAVGVLLALLAGCGGGSNDGDGGDDGRDLTVAQLNFLHGTSGACNQLDNCRLGERADLLFQWIEGSGCPDVVTLQEIWRGSLPLLQAGATTTCPFVYEVVVSAARPGPDEAVILSRYPVLATEVQALFPGFRKVTHVRIDHPLGPLDVYTTHLASGTDGGNLGCDVGTPPCPEACRAAGAVNRRDCQAVQMAAFVAATHSGDAPAVVSGDFNAAPGSFVYQQFADRGWRDVYLAAGNPECDAATGVGCTSGRVDEALTDLESPAQGVNERIDFVFLIAPRNGFACRPRLDPAADRDGDGSATRNFTDLPNPFAPACGAAPLPPCWPSDHEGVEMDLNCD